MPTTTQVGRQPVPVAEPDDGRAVGAGVIARARPEPQVDAVLAVQVGEEAPTSGPSTRSSGRAAVSTTVTSRAGRARAAAATSSPIQPAPTTRRVAGRSRALSGRRVLEGAQVGHAAPALVGQRPGGAARDPVASSSRS